MSDAAYSQIALLVLDVQPVFLKAISWPHDYVQRTRFAIEAAKLLGVRVCFTEQMPDKLGRTEASLLEAAGADAPVFGKSAFSALREDGFAQYLQTHDIAHLLIAGIEVPICLYQTCLDADAQELPTTVLSDCVAGRRPSDCAAIEHTLRASGTHWLPAESVFYSLMGDAMHPDFKAFTSLVKSHS